MGVAVDPPLVAANRAGFIHPGDFVVGIEWTGSVYAVPYHTLFHTPVVVIPDRAGSVVLVWSAGANRAWASPVSRDTSGRDLEVVSDPVDALILYNGRLGEFINGVTGLQPDGRPVTGFGPALPVVKTTWSDWRRMHPQTRIVAPYEATLGPAPTASLAPTRPLPTWAGGGNDYRSVCVIATTQPVAIPSESITDRPMNISAGPTALVVVRIDGVVRAFDRQVKGNLTPRFSPAVQPKHGAADWNDSDTAAEWSPVGAVVDGPNEMRGLKLRPVPVEDDLYWEVEHFWTPAMHLISDAELADATKLPPVVKAPLKTAPSRPTHRKAKLNPPEKIVSIQR